MAKKIMIIVAMILSLVSSWHMDIAESRPMSSSSSKKMIALKSSDGESFEVDVAVAFQSQTIKNMIEEASDDSVDFPLPNVTSKILAKVIVYCKKHVDSPKTEELKKWDTEFVEVDHRTLFDLLLAGNYLNITSLVDLTVHTIGGIMRGKTVEEIRRTFNVKDDCTLEGGEEEIHRENQWAWSEPEIFSPRAKVL